MSKKNSILFVGNFFSKHRSWEEVPDRLQALGFNVITTSSYVPKLLRLINMISVTYHRRKEFELAIVDVFSGPAFIWAELVTFLLIFIKRPFILVLRGGGLVEFSLENHHRVARLFKQANVIITASKYLQERFKDTRADIVYLPNGIDIDKYSFLLRLQVRPRLIWLRAFHSIYSPTVAIDALQRLMVNYPDAHLTMIGPDKGDGTFNSALDRIIEYSLKGKVFFTGEIPKDQVNEQLSSGDIFLNTTKYESFGESVLEAAACGLCIVTTNVGELSYLWEDGVDALLVPPNDPDAMAAAVKRILEEPGLAEKLSGNARKKAERFDWEIVIPQWETVIEKVISHA